jgi:ABC-type Mn2+/Zn2+ transport system permease subunit
MESITWAERVELFRFPILATLIAAGICPLLGVYLYVRRTSFYGVALPQFATAGVVCGFLVLPWWVTHVGLGELDAAEALADLHAAINYHLAWAAVFTFGGLLALVWFGRHGGSEIGRVAAAFAIASAATILFARFSPVGKSWVEQLLTGEVIGVGLHELETLAALLGLALACIAVFHRDFAIVSYDRETARVLGKPVAAFEVLLNAITGLAISVGTLTLGPILVFGLLVLPPLAARAWARSMTGFLVQASLLGVAAGVLGIALAFQFDLPIGAAVVGAAALALVPAPLARGRRS